MNGAHRYRPKLSHVEPSLAADIVLTPSVIPGDLVDSSPCLA